MVIPHRLVSSCSVQLRECLALYHGGLDVASLTLALPTTSMHLLVSEDAIKLPVHALLVLSEGDVIPLQLVPGQADVGTALLPRINQGCRSPSQALPCLDVAGLRTLRHWLLSADHQLKLWQHAVLTRVHSSGYLWAWFGNSCGKPVKQVYRLAKLIAGKHRDKSVSPPQIFSPVYKVAKNL
jgi:hypothetical protein